MALACETGSRWHHRVLTLVSKLIEAKTQTVAPLLQHLRIIDDGGVSSPRRSNAQ